MVTELQIFDVQHDHAGGYATPLDRVGDGLDAFPRSAFKISQVDIIRLLNGQAKTA